MCPWPEAQQSGPYRKTEFDFSVGHGGRALSFCPYMLERHLFVGIHWMSTNSVWSVTDNLWNPPDLFLAYPCIHPHSFKPSCPIRFCWGGGWGGVDEPHDVFNEIFHCRQMFDEILNFFA